MAWIQAAGVISRRVGAGLCLGGSAQRLYRVNYSDKRKIFRRVSPHGPPLGGRARELYEREAGLAEVGFHPARSKPDFKRPCSKSEPTRPKASVGSSMPLTRNAPSRSPRTCTRPASMPSCPRPSRPLQSTGYCITRT